jgi:hypothetical protein
MVATVQIPSEVVALAELFLKKVIAKAEIPEQVVVMVEILHEGSRDG